MSKLSWHSVASICALFVTVALWGCGSSNAVMQEQDVADPNVVALYAGQTLTLSEFENRYARSVGGVEDAKADSFPDYEDFLNRYVDFRLKVIEAKAIGLGENPELVDEMEQYKRQLARPYLVDQEVVEGLVQDLYNRRQEEVSASHILVRVGGNGSAADTLAAFEKVTTLRDSVVAGTPFGEIAARNSEDPSAAQNKGYLGVFTGGRMIKAFEDKAYETPVGEVSEVFRTRFGYHFLKVESREPTTAEIRAAHILIRAAEGDTVEAYATVQEILAKINAGEEFSDLALQYSEDQGSAAQGGDLGFFGRGRMVPSFEKAAFALQEIGDVSPPVRSRFGYHIIKLTDRADLPTYDEAYDDLKALVQRLPRFAAAEAALASRYREELGSSIDTMAIVKLTEGFSTDSVLFALGIKKWSDEEKQTVIATMGSRDFTLGEFLDFGREARETTPASYDLAETVSTLNRMLDSKTLDVAASRLEDTDPDFKDLMNEYRDGIMLFRIMEDSVWNKANTDTVGLMELYEANAANYEFPDRRRVISFYAASDTTLARIAKGWSPGDTTDWTPVEEDDAFRIDTTFIADSTNSIYDQALTLNPGETTAPIRYRRGYILFALDGIDAARQKTFQEARADVVTELQAKLEQEWLDRLHEKYDVTLFPDNLSNVFMNDEPEMGMEQ